MDDFPVNQMESGNSALIANADAENLSENVQPEQSQHQDGTEQTSDLEKLVETMVEEQNTLRKSNEELLTKNHELETSLQQLQGEAGITFCFSVASLIISILTIAAFIILRNKLTKHFERELYIEDKTSGERISCSGKISELSQEIQRLNLIEQELYIEDKSLRKKVSCREKISELSQEIQQLHSTVAKCANKTSFAPENAVDKIPSGFAQSVQSPLQFPLPKANASFTDEFNDLMSLRESATFSTELATFIKKYKVKAFSCSNSKELIQDSAVTPIFKEESANERAYYWAYENGDSYEVVPSPYVQIYNDSVNIGRAFGEVFESNFEFGEYFTDIQVKKPALFKKSGVQWILQSRGKLLLK